MGRVYAILLLHIVLVHVLSQLTVELLGRSDESKKRTASGQLMELGSRAQEFTYYRPRSCESVVEMEEVLNAEHCVEPERDTQD